MTSSLEQCILTKVHHSQALWSFLTLRTCTGAFRRRPLSKDTLSTAVPLLVERWRCRVSPALTASVEQKLFHSPDERCLFDLFYYYIFSIIIIIIIMWMLHIIINVCMWSLRFQLSVEKQRNLLTVKKTHCCRPCRSVVRLLNDFVGYFPLPLDLVTRYWSVFIETDVNLRGSRLSSQCCLCCGGPRRRLNCISKTTPDKLGWKLQLYVKIIYLSACFGAYLSYLRIENVRDSSCFLLDFTFALDSHLEINT